MTSSSDESETGDEGGESSGAVDGGEGAGDAGEEAGAGAVRGWDAAVDAGEEEVDDEESEGWVDALRERYPKFDLFMERVAPFATAIYFAGGVVFDTITLTQYLNAWTLAYVCMYASGVGIAMVVRARRWFEHYREWVDGVLHFCLGATFSALIALYFRSAGHFWAWVPVLMLAGVMAWNEVAARGQPRRSIVWGAYGASLIMLFNFVLPYAIGTISSAWFYLSIILVMATLYGLRHLARIPDLSLGASGAFAVALIGLYLFGAIPPVPLVMRQNVACVGARKTDNRYICAGRESGWLAYIGLTYPEVKYVDGERVSVLSAVSAPRGFVSTLEHRWARWDGEEWKQYDIIEVQMTGGRDEGWRFYSYKQNIQPGTWRVATAVPDGRVVGYAYIDLIQVEPGDLPDRKKLELD